MGLVGDANAPASTEVLAHKSHLSHKACRAVLSTIVRRQPDEGGRTSASSVESLPSFVPPDGRLALRSLNIVFLATTDDSIRLTETVTKITERSQ
jgi:hypothetical protein